MTGSTTIVERDVEVPMRDGAVLRCDVWRPAAGGPHPVLAQRTPYDKGESLVSIHHAGIEPLRATGAGFAVVMQDVRGRFASEGEFCPFAQEAADGADTIAWLRAQPFCDGRVCTYGTSYLGATQLLAAGAAPEGLAAFAATKTGADYHEGWSHRGGALELGFVARWAAADLAPEALRRRAAAGEDVAALRAALDARLRDLDAAYAAAPLGAPSELTDLVPAYGDWLAHPAAGPYWRALAPDFGRMTAAGLHVGGWFDLFLTGTLHAFTTLQARGAAPQKLVVGPWSHGATGADVGELAFGPEAGQAALDLTRVQLDFFAAALAGRLDEIPPVRIFVMGANRWREESAWPPARMRPQRLHLRTGGALSAEPAADDEAPDGFRYDPAEPVPTVGGATFLPDAGPRDQRAVHARPDVLLYTGAPLTRPVELTGPLSVTLWAATSAADTDWTAKLLDVHPDGRAMSVADGILRARRRAGLDREAFPEPGVPAPYRIDLGATSLVIGAGHRIGLEVSSSSFPRFDRHPNTAGAPAAATPGDFVVAEQTVFHDARRASYLEVPVTEGTVR